jgi:type III secretion system needle length determinant
MRQTSSQTEASGPGKADEEVLRAFDRHYRQEPREKPRNAPATGEIDAGEDQEASLSSLLSRHGKTADEDALRAFDRNNPQKHREAPQNTLEAEKPGAGAHREANLSSPDGNAADENALRVFDRNYRQEHRPFPQDAPLEEKPGAEEHQETSLSSLMSSLFSERMGTQPAPTPAPVTAPVEAAPSRMEATVEHLVDQILISHPDLAGDKEVRLMVKDSVLPDTEIRLARGTDGLLSVTLATGRSDAFQTLVAARAELKQALDTQEKLEVRITVLDTREAGADDADSNRRSRGHAAYMPDDDDTR